MRHLPLLLLGLISSTPVLVCAAQTNTTVDDASPLLTYRADAPLDRNLTGFDKSLLIDGTATGITPTTNGFTPTISMNFTGSAFYVYVAFPSGHAIPVALGFYSFIDGVYCGGWSTDQTGPMYNRLAYVNRTMPEGPHTILLHVPSGWALWFDYIVYTSGDPPPAPPTQGSTAAGIGVPGASQPTSGPSTAPGGASADVPGSTQGWENASGSGLPPSTTPDPGSSAMSTAASVPPGSQSSAIVGALAAASGSDSRLNSDSTSGTGLLPSQITSTADSDSSSDTGHTSVSIGAIVGAAIGGLLFFCAGILMFCCLRRRRRRLDEPQKIRKQPDPFLAEQSENHYDEKRALYGTPESSLHTSSQTGSEQLDARPMLSLSIPTPGPGHRTTQSASMSPMVSASATESAFMAIAQEVRRLTETVQRLEGTEGNRPFEQPPPVYGD